METSQLKTMSDIVRASNNPTAMINAMANSNPALKEILTEISSAKADPKDIFYAKAREKGMSDRDIENFLTSLKSTFKM